MGLARRTAVSMMGVQVEDMVRGSRGVSAAGRLARLSTLFAALLGALFLIPTDSEALVPASIPDVFDGAVACSEQGDGSRYCGSSSPRSTVETFDGVPIDVNVAFPPAPATGPDGNYPLIMIFHGYGGGKIGFGTMQRWLDKGYAVFSMTDRGFRESCGSAAAQAADPVGCAEGYVRLIDNRYEVRDAQEFAGMLADEGLIDPQRIGATGGSYGGGLSLALAALRNRKAMPDGTLVPWESPAGKPMEIAAATPFITWSDLAYSLVPNGSTLDYVVDSPYSGRYGVMKESLVSGLYFSGIAAPGFYAPEGGDPSADLTGWRKRLLEGEPYDGDPGAEQILNEITGNHSPYYIDDSVAPAPLLLANGFTDDLFPVDEMVRFFNRTRATHPDAKVGLFAAEIAGHPRSQRKPDALDALQDRVDRWFDHFLMGKGDEPASRVEAYTQTCPSDADSGGPFRARDWARIAPGEVRVRGDQAQGISAEGGDPDVAAAFNSVSGGGACAQTDGADDAGTANLRSEPAPPGGFTMIGSPLVVASYQFGGQNSQVAARLLDVGPDGMQTLVARGLWRPRIGSSDPQAFQMHPGAWTFEEGHVAKLELLGADADPGFLGPYGRPSNNQQPIEVTDLRLRLPVAERPGSSGGFIGATVRKPLADGAELAPGFKRIIQARAQLAEGALKRRGRALIAKASCPGLFDSCNDGKIVVKRNPRRGGKAFKAAAGGFELAGGTTAKVSMKLTKRGRRWFRNHGAMPVTTKTSTTERPGSAVQKRRARG
jgi:predicted acyl esterase